MAFGKDNAGLTRVSDFRKAGQVSNRKFPKRGGGGGGWRFRDNYKPSTVEPDRIRLILGAYDYIQVNGKKEKILHKLPYMRFAEHFDGRTKGSTICSAGPFVMYRDLRDPCLGCDLYWEGGGKKESRVSRREMYALTLLNYGTFHEVEETDRETGQVRMNEKTGKPYTQWVRCTGRRCDGCAAGKPTKKGHIQHWELGFGHFNALKDYSKYVGRNCLSCGTPESILPLAYLCEHCKEAVIDMSTTTLTDEEIAKAVDDEVVCPHCGQDTFLEEVIQCSACPAPARAGLYDVDLFVKRVQGEGNQTSLHFTGHGPIAPIDPVFDAKPLDFEKMYAPDTLEKQSEKFKEPPRQTPPKTPTPNTQAARPYGGGQPQQQYSPPPAQAQYQPPPQQQYQAPAPQQQPAPSAQPRRSMFSR